MARTFNMPGSKAGTEYVVVLEADDGDSCTCKAFEYSKSDPPTCKHIKGAWAQWIAETEPSGKPAPAAANKSPAAETVVFSDGLTEHPMGECMVCGQQAPIWATGLCGPCTTGDASTLGE